MISQLLVSKKLYHEGCRQLSLNDPISDGLAVSLFQDAVEIYIWTLIKERSIDVGKNPEFTNNLGSIANSGTSVPLKAKLLELNKARVNFKHYGNLPAHRDAEKFRSYAQDFWSIWVFCGSRAKYVPLHGGKNLVLQTMSLCGMLGNSIHMRPSDQFHRNRTI